MNNINLKDTENHIQQITLEYLKGFLFNGKEKISNIGFTHCFIGKPDDILIRNEKSTTWNYYKKYEKVLLELNEKFREPYNTHEFKFPSKTNKIWYDGQAPQKWIACLCHPYGAEVVKNTINVQLFFISLSHDEKVSKTIELAKKIHYHNSKLTKLFLVEEYIINQLKKHKSSAPIVNSLYINTIYIAFVCAIIRGYEEEQLIKIFRKLNYNDISECLYKSLESDISKFKSQNSLVLPLKQVKAFVYESNPERSFIIENREDDTLKIDINYHPTDFFSNIPQFGGFYFQFFDATDISASNEIAFDIKIEKNNLRRIKLEPKPFEQKWMHESFDIFPKTSWQEIRICISDFENHNTSKYFGEITWAIYCNFFKDIHHLDETIYLRNLRIE